MSNAPWNNGNHILCKRSLVTRLDGLRIVTGNGTRGFQAVTILAFELMTLSAGARI
jgi:hypothetical protein